MALEVVENRRDELERLADREDLRSAEYARVLLEAAESEG
jgi:hypothetical protein